MAYEGPDMPVEVKSLVDARAGCGGSRSLEWALNQVQGMGEG